MIDWQSLFAQLGSTVVIVGIIGYIGKRLTEQWLAQRLQQHKNSLDEASQRAIEQIRYDLRIAEARQGRLLARQAAIVAGVFARLERVHEAMSRLAAPINHGETGALSLRDAAADAFDAFASYYHERAIWLEPSICTQLNSLVSLLGTLLTKMNYNLQPNGQIQDRTRWLDTYQGMQNEVPAARWALECQFRMLLGVDVAAHTPTVTSAARTPVSNRDDG